MANFWQMQLHPGNSDWDLEKVDNLLLNYSVIGMGDQWENDGGGPYRFENEVAIGDIFIIRHSGSPRYLVEVIGECTKNEGDNKIDVWFAIYRKVKILSNEGPHYKSKYAQDKSCSWTDGLFAPTTFQTANNWDFAKYWYNNILNRINMEQYKTLLTRNYNLILTGAPGTGKTYLAKQIAAQMILDGNEDEETKKNKMGEQCGFVQFHPSYDYTDFVEGLRPKQDGNGNVGFKRRDGVFKEFCKKALKTLTFEACYFDLLRDISNSENFTLKQKGGNDTTALSVDEEKRIRWFERNTPQKTASNNVSLDNLKTLYKKYNTFEKLNDINDINEEIRETIDKTVNATYYWVVLNEVLHRMEKKYVFIIDEINRGEISKIFGELFFSIDPGYRGENGKVKTQYQNLIEENDEFYDGFYAPENVYIIGTMNDIDRSVESMDFAFRRRFAFKEVKAIDRVEMLYDINNGIGSYADEAKERMNRLNKEIEKIEGLSTAYHIGPAYFLKLKNYDGDFQQLWDNHLEGLLCEYLRGMQDVDEKINKLKAAYNNESDPNN